MNTFLTGLRTMLLAVTLIAGATAAVPALLPSVATVHIKDFKYGPPALTITTAWQHLAKRLHFFHQPTTW